MRDASIASTSNVTPQGDRADALGISGCLLVPVITSCKQLFDGSGVHLPDRVLGF